MRRRLTIRCFAFLLAAVILLPALTGCSLSGYFDWLGNQFFGNGETQDTTDRLPEETGQSETEQNKTTVDDVIVDLTDSAYSYADMQADLAMLAACYPDRFSYESFGQSFDGRQLYWCRIGNPDAQHKLLVVAGMHAREYISSHVAMAQAEFLLANADKAKTGGMTWGELLDECVLYLVPMLNPDGVMLCQEGISSVLNEKTEESVMSVYRSDLDYGLVPSDVTINTYLRIFWKANAEGTDLNRNYDALWSSYRKILQPCFSNYKGSSPESAPETAAMAGFIRGAGTIDAVLSIHTQGRTVYWDCGQEGSVRSETLSLAQAVCNVTGYSLNTTRNNDASLTDWMVLVRGVPAVTVEVAVGEKYPLDTSQVPGIVEETQTLFAAALYFVVR